MGTPTGATTRSEHVEIESPDGVALLVDWLSEVLFLFDARNFVPREIDADVEEWRIRATIGGGNAADFDQGGAAVKAITYHDAMLERTPGGYEARVYLDL